MLRAAAAVLLLCAPAAQGAQFHVPLHAPPRVWPEAGGKTSLLLGGGYFAAGARGLQVDGPGGGWELGAPLGERLSGHVQSLGTAFGGTLDPLGSRSRKTSGMSGALEADLAFAPGGREGSWRAYAGAQLGFTVLSMAGTGPTFAKGAWSWSRTPRCRSSSACRWGWRRGGSGARGGARRRPI
ncbi:MAG: hypothetical protein HYV15_06760 [Elusimicrobia bacterium]|nr:hypothetical protein [Elusimicrobiota bacterium]